MKLELTPEITIEAMYETLKAEFPQYVVSSKKNPIAKFEYVEVRKSGTVGVWVRILDKKNEVHVVNCIPSAGARALFGGLLVLAFVWGAQSKVRKEVGPVLINKFNTKEV